MPYVNHVWHRRRTGTAPDVLQYAVRGLVARAVSVTESGGGSEDIGRTSHSHPALSEAMRQAALNVEERALHIINR
jgi:hypothetical protein